MAKIHFVDHKGETRTVEIENGATVMEAAIRNSIPGIEAECGGACACATCHVYVDEAWREKVGSPTPMEEDMLDFGYDISIYRDVDPMFGTLDDFKALLAKAHRLGLKVMIDQVISHSSDRHPWFAESRDGGPEGDKADWYVWADPKPDGNPPNNWLSIFGGSNEIQKNIVSKMILGL